MGPLGLARERGSRQAGCNARMRGRMPPVQARGGRSPRLVCALVLLAGVAVLHREVLFGGQVYHMDDAADGYYPSHVAARRALAARQLPTAERGASCRWPLSGDPHY